MPSSSGRPQTLPFSEEAERVLLGSILTDPESNFPKISSVVKSRDFYLEAHRIVYSCLLEMQACSVPIDMITLRESLRGNGDEERVGGASFIANLTEFAGSNVEYYAEMVKKKADERRLLFAINNAQTAFMSGDGSTALADLKTALEQVEIQTQEIRETDSWQTVNCLNDQDWQDVPAIEWCCEPLIPRGGFLGFVGGAPKDGKSALIMDLCIQLAQAQYSSGPEPIKFLGRFSVRGERVLYVAKEDDVRRLKMRWPDINRSYGYTDPPDLTFLPRKLTSMDLTKPEHLTWLKNLIVRDRYSFIVLDVLSELIPGMDEMKESRQVLTSLKDIVNEFGVTIMVLDHIRKPEQAKSGRTKQEANPFELRSLMAKYGASDFVIMLARTKDADVLKMHCESKESDQIEDLLIKRTAFGVTDQPKHSILANLEDLGERSRERGNEVRANILQHVPDEWRSLNQIVTSSGLPARTLRYHLKQMVENGSVEAQGGNRNRLYRRIATYEQEEMEFE